MANKFVYEISANTQGYVKGVNDAKESNIQFDSSIQVVGKDTDSLKKQLNAAKKEVINLTATYRQLTDAQKQSASGRELLKKLNEEKNKAAELLDTFTDVNQEIKAMASDTASWDAMKQGADVVKNGLMALSTTIGSVTGNEEELGQMVKKLAQIETTFNTVIAIGNALQKNSALMSRINTIQTAALTRATNLQTAATTKATIAQRAFNLVAKANPYVLLATALVAVGAALFAWTKHSTTAAAKQKEENERLKQLKERWDDYRSSIVNTTTNVVADYKLMQAEWKSLSSSQERSKWIEKNQTKFKNLGLSIHSVRDAEKVFEQNTAAVVSALKARAEAAAWAEIYKKELIGIEDEYRKKIDESTNAIVAGANAAKVLTKEEREQLGIREKDYTTINSSIGAMSQAVDHALTAEEASAAAALRTSKYAAERTTQLEKADKILDTVIDKEKEAAKAEKELGDLFDTTNTKAGKGVDYEKHSIAELEAAIQKLKSNQQNKVNPLSKEQYQQTLKELESELKQKKIHAGLQIEIEEGSAQWYIEKIDELTRQQKTMKIGSTGWTELQQQIDHFNREKIDIEASVKYSKNSEDWFKQQLSNLQVELDKVEIGSQRWREIQEQIKSLNKQKIDIEAEINADQIQRDIDKIVKEALTVDEDNKFDFSFLSKNMQDEAKKLETQTSQIKSTLNSIDEVLSNPDAYSTTEIERYTAAQKQLKEQLDQNLITLEEYNKLSAKQKDRTDKIEKQAEAWGYYGSMLNSVSSGLDALGDSEEAQVAKFAISTAAMIANCIKEIAALQAKAIAAGTASSAGLPPPFNLAAIASIIATITSIFASLPKFEDGGVVGGTSYSGDNVLIRANSGERILTRHQNDILEDALDNNTLTNAIDNNKLNNPTVVDVRMASVKVRGADIYLSQENYKKISGKK